MKWIIDLLKGWVLAQGYLSAGFVDRGNVTTYDWTDRELVTDGNWHDLSLIPRIPPGTKGVAFTISLRAALVGSYFQLRTKGNPNTPNSTICRIHVANVFTDEDFVVAPDAAYKIEYRGSDIAFTNIYLTIKSVWY